MSLFTAYPSREPTGQQERETGDHQGSIGEFEQVIPPGRLLKALGSYSDTMTP